jgi:sodium-coupled neutral amino acid transporter 11
MIVIVITVITQGFRVPSEARGEIKSQLIFNSGFFQAVGVISFGELRLFSATHRNIH